jgi:all-trans-retinol 13,14-reductase
MPIKIVLPFEKKSGPAGSAYLEFEELDPDGYDTLVYPDFVFKIPKGIEVFRDRLCEYFPGEKRGIDRYITLLRQMDPAISRSRPTNAPSSPVRSPFAPPSTVRRPRALRA